MRGLKIDANGNIIAGIINSKGATCLSHPSPMKGTLKNNRLSYTHDNGCGKIDAKITLKDDGGNGAWHNKASNGNGTFTLKKE